jgi:lactoylglutathione lyase
MNTKELVEEYNSRIERRDFSAIDDYVAEDFVNHAAGAQGSAGLHQIISVLEHDIAFDGVERHHLFSEGDLCCYHVTLWGTHRASTMPLLKGVPVSGARVSWRFIHILRVADGKLVEHWACRDDHGLLTQIHAALQARVPAPTAPRETGSSVRSTRVS